MDIKTLIHSIENGHQIYTKEEVLNLLRSVPAVSPSEEKIYAATLEILGCVIDDIKSALKHDNNLKDYVEISLEYERKPTLEISVDGESIFNQLNLSAKKILEEIKDKVEENSEE